MLEAAVFSVILSSVWIGCGTRVETGESPHAAEQARRNPPPARGNGAQTSLFLPSHKSLARSAPDAGDVGPSFHVRLEQLRERVAADSTDAASVLELARLLQDGHRIEEAVVTYRRHLRLEPQSRDGWLDLAKAYGSLGRWHDALSASDSLLVRFPDDPSGLYNRGAVLANLGRKAEARQMWLKVSRQEADPQMQKMAEAALSRLGE